MNLAISQQLTTGHPCVRFIKEFTFNPIMDTQANLFRYSNQQETDSSQTIAYPLVDGAKKLCKNGKLWGYNGHYKYQEYIQKQREAKLGYKNPNWKGDISSIKTPYTKGSGKTRMTQKEYLMSEENINRLRLNRKNQLVSPSKGKKLWVNKEHPRGMLGKKNFKLIELNKTEKFKEAQKRGLEKMNNNLLLRQKMFLSRHKRPTKPEKIVMNILNKIYPNEFKYTGNGEFIIGGLCPDFVNCNGKKKIIEVFGEYWHKSRADKETDTEEGRKRIFSIYGYDCLVIWDNELKNLLQVTNKIKSFMED